MWRSNQPQSPIEKERKNTNRKSECWRGFTVVLAIAGATLLYVVGAGFISDECTGRFAGAVGTITRLAPVPPNGYLVEGTISTVGATKK